MERTGATRWQDWMSFALGLWLAVSPWTFGYFDHDTATANAAIVGLLLALASHFGLSIQLLEEEWLNLAFGLWLVAAPFLLGFSTNWVAMGNSLAVGALAAMFAAWAMALDRDIFKRLPKRFAGH